ncbi:MAG: short-subunit dehydrogenase [Arenicella sp.]|jgi:short-subunit dehydrogenase
MNLQNKKIVVTGASGGIGTQTAMLLASGGANLVLVGRNQVTLDSIVEALPASSQSHQTIVADLTSGEGRQLVIAAATQADALINMAGINQLALLTQMSDRQVIDMITCNLTVPMLLTKEILPILKSRPEASIINVGSILGSIGMPGSAAYCASKFGLRGFTEALHRELSDTNITVSYVAPRTTQTKMNGDAATALNTALGNNVDTPELVAKIIVETLESSKSERKYIGWPEKLFVRINALLPNVVDGSLIKQLPIIQKYTQ